VTQLPEGRALVFDLQDPTARVVLAGHPLVSRVAISPDGRWAGHGAWLNSKVNIWDARNGDLVPQLLDAGQNLGGFQPGWFRWLATSSRDYQLLEAGFLAAQGPGTPGHEDSALNYLCFSPDGKMMARTDGRKIHLMETLSESFWQPWKLPVSAW